MRYWPKEKIVACVVHAVLLLSLLLARVVFTRLYADMLAGEPLPFGTELAMHLLFLAIPGLALFVGLIAAKKGAIVYLLCVDIVWAMPTLMLMLLPLLRITFRLGS